MANTKTVRQILAKYNKRDIFTNKVKDPNFRAIKCYYNSFRDAELVAELIKVAGSKNVKIIDNSDNNFVADSITVRCEFVN